MIPLNLLTRHVGIFGATGSGKTNSALHLLQSLPVPFLALDAKGDLGATIAPRMSCQAIGPGLMARALDLSEAQSGILGMAYAWADDTAAPLDSLADLRAALAADLSPYGLATMASVAACHRAILRIERAAPWLFGTAPDWRLQRGVVACHLIADIPGLYGAFAAHVMDSLYRGLGEIGEGCGLVLMIDESHLLFDGATAGIVRRIDQVTRLIRSKGVGLVYVSQSPEDLPDSVLGQLNSRVQHRLTAATAKQAQAVKAASWGMGDVESLAIGQAIVRIGAAAPVVRRIDRAKPVSLGNVTLPHVAPAIVLDDPPPRRSWFQRIIAASRF